MKIAQISLKSYEGVFHTGEFVTTTADGQAKMLFLSLRKCRIDGVVWDDTMNAERYLTMLQDQI